MKMIKSYIIDGIDYRKLWREMEDKAKFQKVTWEDHYCHVLMGICKMREEIVEASMNLSEARKKDKPPLGYDPPTDIMWVLSIIFVLRTIEMLNLKSTNKKESTEDRQAHTNLLKKYVSILNKIIKDRDQFVREKIEL